MHPLDSQNAADYLRSTGHAAAGEPIQVQELAGGVSNIVLLVTFPIRGERFVLKQARARLRVQEEWLCPIERIWREVETLKISCQLLDLPREGRLAVEREVSGPKLLWEDRENYLYAMTAAPPEHKTWKELLLAGALAEGPRLAIACGEMLGRLHAGSWRNPSIATELADSAYFEQLRVDPYYRHVARVHPDLAPAIDALIAALSENRRTLVHGDFSPKNLLVWPGNLMLIDFEVGHYGDPAFDLGFFLTHLVLKSIWAGERQDKYLQLATDFWRTYRKALSMVVSTDELVSLEQRMLWNLAGCLLARVDGKSPIEYLSADQRQRVRDLASRWIVSPPRTWDATAVLSTEY